MQKQILFPFLHIVALQIKEKSVGIFKCTPEYHGRVFNVKFNKSETFSVYAGKSSAMLDWPINHDSRGQCNHFIEYFQVQIPTNLWRL